MNENTHTESGLSLQIFSEALAERTGCTTVGTRGAKGGNGQR